MQNYAHSNRSIVELKLAVVTTTLFIKPIRMTVTKHSRSVWQNMPLVGLLNSCWNSAKLMTTYMKSMTSMNAATQSSVIPV